MTKLMLFGGCNLRGPFRRMQKGGHKPQNVENWSKVPKGVTYAGVPYMTYTLGEMIQSIGFYKASRYIPREIRLMAGIPADFIPNSRLGIRHIDAVLIEPNTSVEILFEGYYLSRNRILKFLDPIRALSADMDKLAGRWYHRGIGVGNEGLRSTIAEEIIEKLPATFPDLHFTTAVLRSARGEKRPLAPAFKEIAALVDRPIGVVGYIWSYMPDGRPISWPADFGKEVRTAAAEAGLPYLDVGSIVGKHGIKSAIGPDLRHYREDFQPIVARHLVEFVQGFADTGHGRREPGEKAESVSDGAPETPRRVSATEQQTPKPATDDPGTTDASPPQRRFGLRLWRSAASKIGIA